MRGERKPSTLAKLDRLNVLPFYITPKQKFLYDQDDYKYLIHLYRLFPSDHYHVLQYIMLRFYPLVLRICHKYHQKGINLDWLELLSFARHAFAELVMRFPLNSTLYFRKYLPLALDRAINDHQIYLMRRKAVLMATRLSDLEPIVQDGLIRAGVDLQNIDLGGELDLGEMLTEVEGLLDDPLVATPQERAFFLERYIQGLTIEAIALKRKLEPTYVIKRLKGVAQRVKQHMQQNYL